MARSGSGSADWVTFAAGRVVAPATPAECFDYAIEAWRDAFGSWRDGLRKKLDAHGPSLIHTARGIGYALRLPR